MTNKTHMKSATYIGRTLCGKLITENTITVENDTEKKDEVTCNNCKRIIERVTEQQERRKERETLQDQLNNR